MFYIPTVFTSLFQAAELLRHPHLQPYVFKINLKFDNPRRNTLPVSYYDNPRKPRYLEAEEIPKRCIDREKRRSSYSNDRTQNPSISGPEPDSPYSIRQQPGYSTYMNRKFEELSIGSSHKEIGVDKPIMAKGSSTVAKTPRLSTTPSKGTAAFRRLSTPSQISTNGSNRTSVSSFIRLQFSLWARFYILVVYNRLQFCFGTLAWLLTICCPCYS